MKYLAPSRKELYDLPILARNAKNHVVGFASFKHKNNDTDVIVFTRISHFSTWIVCNSPGWSENTKKMEECGECDSQFKYENVDLQSSHSIALIYNLNKNQNCKHYKCAATLINSKLLLINLMRCLFFVFFMSHVCLIIGMETFMS